MKYAYKNKIYVILLSAFLAYPIDRSVHHWVLFDLNFGGIVWRVFCGFTWVFFSTPLYFSAVIPGTKSMTLVPCRAQKHSGSPGLSYQEQRKWMKNKIYSSKFSRSHCMVTEATAREWMNCRIQETWGQVLDSKTVQESWREWSMAGPTVVRDDGWTNLLRYFWQWGNFTSCILHILSKIFGLAHVRYVSGLSLSTAYVSVFEKSSVCFSALNPGS